MSSAFQKGKLRHFTAQQDIAKSTLYKVQIKPLVRHGEWDEKRSALCPVPEVFASNKTISILFTRNIPSLSPSTISAKLK